jgi:PleD family two-component response regulator
LTEACGQNALQVGELTCGFSTLVTTLTGRRHDASVSIGIASLVPSTDASPTPRSVMSAADEALYRAKRDGGNRVAHGRL